MGCTYVDIYAGEAPQAQLLNVAAVDGRACGPRADPSHSQYSRVPVGPAPLGRRIAIMQPQRIRAKPG